MFFLDFETTGGAWPDGCGGTLECGGTCRDLSSDTRNCGACGNGCPDDRACTGGFCPCVDASSNADGHCCPSGWQLLLPAGGGPLHCFLGPMPRADSAGSGEACRQATGSAFGFSIRAVGEGIIWDLDTFSLAMAAPEGACGWYLTSSEMTHLVALYDQNPPVLADLMTPCLNGGPSCTTCPCPSASGGTDCAQSFFCVVDALGPTVDGACSLDGQCPPGGYCDGGVCLDRGLDLCATDTDCAPRTCLSRGPFATTGVCSIGGDPP